MQAIFDLGTVIKLALLSAVGGAALGAYLYHKAVKFYRKHAG
ncbi:hypothetical protein [Herbaspirillum huttiense]|uniref:Uncharacterized protein n=1 Tax=Herbaspirillum huttiense subsp. lycopersici TaxID=3074428 RepID=A0ABU2EGX0_9BURK|nr:hypothetical protein [Herbaspirillum huttiense]MDR9847103.1 hypothetical protein [Herbaspirillum huttiense SE1]